MLSEKTKQNRERGTEIKNETQSHYAKSQSWYHTLQNLFLGLVETMKLKLLKKSEAIPKRGNNIKQSFLHEAKHVI